MQEEKNSKSLSNVSIFIIIILLLVFVYFIVGDQSLFKKEKSVVMDELESSRQLDIITTSEVLKFPKISSEKNITVSGLPKYLQGLLGDEAMDPLVKSIVYQDKSNGFSMEYTVPDTLKNTYAFFHRDSKTSWPPLDGGRTGGAAFLNIEHELYFIQADFLKIEDTKTAVKVMVINK